MKRTLLIIITAAALLLAACQNTIRYEYDINDGKITLLGQLSSVDSVHSVFLSMSYPDRIDSLADATVSCYVNGERHQASKVHPGYQEQYDIITQEITMVPRKNRYTEYRFQAGFKPGDDVRIEASKGDMKAWVELEVPQPGKIVSVDTVTVVKKWSYQDIDGTDTYEQEYVEFTIRLKDAEGTDSYFTLNAVMAEVTKLFSGELITETLRSAGRLDYETFHDLILEDGYSSGIGDMFEDLLPVNSTHCFSDKMFQDGEALLIDMDTICHGNPIFEFSFIYNAYLGFSDVDHNVVKDFIGITYEQAGEYWKKLLQYYFEGKDDSYLETAQEKAMVMGFVRLLRREIRRDGLNNESGRKFIENAKRHISELVPKLDTLVF